MAAPAAGQKITAAMLGQLGNNTTQKAGAAQTTSTINAGSSAADLTGTSLTFSVAYACTIEINAVFDVNFTNNVDIGSGGPTFIGTCVVDGSTQSGEAHYNGSRATIDQEWIVSLTAGSHTIKLQGARTGSPTGSIQTIATHTKWSAWVPSP